MNPKYEPQTEIKLLRAKVALYEKQQATLFYRLVKHLPKHWEGQSVRALAQAGQEQSLNLFLSEALSWVNDRAAMNRPEVPGITDAGQVDPEPISNARLAGTLR